MDNPNYPRIQIILTVAIFWFIIFNNHWNDDIKFCAIREELLAGLKNPPPYPFYNVVKVNEKPYLINLGGLGCIDDIVKYTIKSRAGPDGFINTKDDLITRDQQLDLLIFLLNLEFDGGHWVNGNWHVNLHNGGAANTKVLYSDANERLVISRIFRDVYSGKKNSFDSWIYSLEGGLFEQNVGSTSINLFSSNHIRPDTLEHANFYTKASKGEEYLYSNPDARGALVLQYSRGKLQSNIFLSYCLPLLYMTWDFSTAWEHLSDYVYSIIVNGILPIFSTSENNITNCHFSERNSTKHTYELDFDNTPVISSLQKIPASNEKKQIDEIHDDDDDDDDVSDVEDDENSMENSTDEENSDSFNEDILTTDKKKTYVDKKINNENIHDEL